LCGLGATEAFTIESHYQLANRLAFAWKLASLGLPVALLYLGFYGDSGLTAAFTCPADWEEVFTAYASSILDNAGHEAHFVIGQAPVWILTRSRKVLSDSPSVAGMIKESKAKHTESPVG
jgi:hypothetical protein